MFFNWVGLDIEGSVGFCVRGLITDGLGEESFGWARERFGRQRPLILFFILGLFGSHLFCYFFLKKKFNYIYIITILMYFQNKKKHFKI